MLLFGKAGLCLALFSFLALESAPVCCPTEDNPHSFKIRASALFPQGGIVRKIYGHAFPEGSVEYDYNWRHFSVFVNAAATGKSGHSIGLRDSTTLVVVPVTIGMNARFGSSWVHPYLGIGIGAAYAHIRNHNSFVPKNSNKGGFASLYQAGIEFDCNSWFFIDLFFDYRWNWFDFNKKASRQTGGIDTGLGFGFRF
jgi:hypothetical protein